MSIARREFLKVVGGASLAGSLGGIGERAIAATGDVSGFGFADESVPMNAANLCPMPTSVTQAHNQYAKQLDLSLRKLQPREPNTAYLRWWSNLVRFAHRI